LAAVAKVAVVMAVARAAVAVVARAAWVARAAARGGAGRAAGPRWEGTAVALEGTGALPGVTGTAAVAERVWVVDRAVEGRAVVVGVVWEDWAVGMAAAVWAAAKGEEARAVA
jgi:hypothetical protein